VAYCKDERVETANKVLGSFTRDTRLRIESGYVVVEWTNHKGRQARRWMTRGQDFYPVWYRQWGHGGTAARALSQLVRWVQGKPVLPISTWEYWAGAPCRLLEASAVKVLAAGGYPSASPCVKCGSTIYRGGLDWWSLDGLSGPACLRCDLPQAEPKR
jgi:hypothetical protein